MTKEQTGDITLVEADNQTMKNRTEFIQEKFSLMEIHR